MIEIILLSVVGASAFAGGVTALVNHWIKARVAYHIDPVPFRNPLEAPQRRAITAGPATGAPPSEAEKIGREELSASGEWWDKAFHTALEISGQIADEIILDGDDYEERSFDGRVVRHITPTEVHVYRDCSCALCMKEMRKLGKREWVDRREIDW